MNWFRVQQKRKGPKGSPYWTPSADKSTLSSQKREDDDEYAEQTRGKMDAQVSRTDHCMLSRLTELKAFEKSSLINASPGELLCRKWRPGWTAASMPPLTPKPNWWGEKRQDMSSTTRPHAILATNLLNVQPTAMGLTPPPHLPNAMRRALKKKWQTEGGVWPSKTRDEKASPLKQGMKSTIQIYSLGELSKTLQLNNGCQAGSFSHHCKVGNGSWLIRVIRKCYPNIDSYARTLSCQTQDYLHINFIANN